MRHVFAHDAVVTIEPGGDLRAPGAAITVALCGHWAHEPPCPLAPHHTEAQRRGEDLRLRVLFAAEADAEAEVRSRIQEALSSEHVEGPDGVTTHWRFRGARPGTVSAKEAEQGERLRQS